VSGERVDDLVSLVSPTGVRVREGVAAQTVKFVRFIRVFSCST